MEDRLSRLLRFIRAEHGDDMRFLLDSAKLGKKPHRAGEHSVGWNNVLKHNVAEAIAMRVLCNKLGIDEEEAKRLERYAFVHNPTIHADKFFQKKAAGDDLSGLPESEVFTDFEQACLSMAHDQITKVVDPEGGLRLATTPEFFDAIAGKEGEDIEHKAQEMPFSDLLVYYIDALFDEGTLLPAHERIAKMEQRRPDLNEDEARTARLGMKYWEAERRVSSNIEMIIWQKLQERGMEFPSPGDVPAFIKIHMREEARIAWNQTHSAEVAIES